MQADKTVIKRLIRTFQLNNEQLAFGAYGAELSFYIILSLVPILLAISNVVAILPFSQEEIITTMQRALPDEVEQTVLPLLSSYLTGTSASAFSLSLLISLWPASNVFSTLQRILNTIYKTRARKGFLIARLFSYVFTLMLVIVLVAFAFILVFGETIMAYLTQFFAIQLPLIDMVLSQGWLIGLVGVFLLVLGIYQFIPNVRWKLNYAIPGTLFTVIGFILVSQLFSLYMQVAGGNIGGGTIGVFMVAIIWLYLNAQVIAVGAYINVFYHDFKVKANQVSQEPVKYQDSWLTSSGFAQKGNDETVMRHRIQKVLDQKGE